MPKVETSSIKYGNILVSDIDLYKELYFRALEEDSAELMQKAIDLIPTIPYGYLAKSFLIEFKIFSDSSKLFKGNETICSSSVNP